MGSKIEQLDFEQLHENVKAEDCIGKQINLF
jgi:hypothetical protein